MELGTLAWVLALLVLAASDELLRRTTGRGLLERIDPWWAAAAFAAIAVLIGAFFLARQKRLRVEEREGRTLIHFGGRTFAIEPQWRSEPPPIEVKRWESGGGFGNPLVSHLSIKVGESLSYEGPAHEGERLLAALQDALKPR